MHKATGKYLAAHLLQGLVQASAQNADPGVELGLYVLPALNPQCCFCMLSANA